MTRLRLSGLPLLSLALALAPGLASSAPPAPYPIPEITEIVNIDVPESLAFVMRGRLGNTDTYLGLSLLCPRSASKRVEVTAYFAGFPADARPVQLTIRGPRGQISRFGPAVRGTPASGFHSPRITDPPKALEFVTAALRPGSLISNGYRSFRNRASQSQNDRTRDAFIRCLRER